MTVNATFSSSPSVSATVSGGTVLASLSGGGPVSATVLSGIGPQGPARVGSLNQASDVQLVAPLLGDVLWYSGAKWTNKPETELVDGGNW